MASDVTVRRLLADDPLESSVAEPPAPLVSAPTFCGVPNVTAAAPAPSALTFTASLPALDAIATGKADALSVTLIVSVPAPASTVTAFAVPVIVIVSLPAPVFTNTLAPVKEENGMYTVCVPLPLEL